MASTQVPHEGSSMAAVDRSDFSGRGRAIAVLAAAVPAIWVIPALLHPDGLAARETGTWLGVHYAQLALAPLLGLAIWPLLGPLGGPAAAVGRVAVVLWVAFFSAFDAIAGIATGLLQDGGFDREAQQLFDHSTTELLGWVAGPLWIVVAVASSLALLRSRARPYVWVSMLVAALFALHAGLVAVIGLAAMALALFTGLAPEERRRADREPRTPPVG